MSSEYRTLAAPVLRETTVLRIATSAKCCRSCTSFATCRRVTPCATSSTPIPATFGLSQRERLQSASETAYQDALERMFRSRLIFRLEEQIEANISTRASSTRR